ncbi:PaaI family thioesterase [Cumulibacter manganitolerans]|uniref:PaaI family thioesterase n=1 Tax=Cumulibacter manganitolerans TaxID=1884992 RepID=UPI0012950545|nr:PaaI family thioesterase [Cumulibacter manganitolerans]
MTVTNNSLPDVSLSTASRFVASSGFVVEEVTPTALRGYVDLSEDHFTPWGVVHGGVYTTIVESAGSIAASKAVLDKGQFAVGVHNATDFLRSSSGGRASVTAEPLFQGRNQQLWEVVITAEETGKVLARGQLRLQNIALPQQDLGAPGR